MPKENRLQVKKNLKCTPEELVEVLKVHNYYVDLFRKWGKIQAENKKDSWLPEEFRLGGQFEEFIKLDKNGKTWYEKNLDEDGLGVWFDSGLFYNKIIENLNKEILKNIPEFSEEYYYLNILHPVAFYIKCLLLILEQDNDVKVLNFEYFYLNEMERSYLERSYYLEHFNLNILQIFTKDTFIFNKLEITFLLEQILKNNKRLITNPNFKIIIKNSDLGIQTAEVRQKLLELEKEGKAEFINCSWSGVPAVRGEERVGIKTDNKIKFDFSKYIPKEYQDIFGDYFMGLKTFVEYAKGEKMNITISVNGGLFVEIEAENPDKMDTILESFKDYFLNLVNLSQNQQPIINTIYPNPDRAFIFLQSKINSLDTQLQLRNSQFIKEQEKTLFLSQLVKNLNQERHFLESKNQELEDSARILQKKIVDLNKQLENLSLANLEKSDQLIIELLLQNLAQLRLVVESKEVGIIKSTIISVDEFYQKNQAKIKLALTLTGQKDKILGLLEYLLNELRKKF